MDEVVYLIAHVHLHVLDLLLPTLLQLQQTGAHEGLGPSRDILLQLLVLLYLGYDLLLVVPQVGHRPRLLPDDGNDFIQGVQSTDIELLLDDHRVYLQESLVMQGGYDDLLQVHCPRLSGPDVLVVPQQGIDDLVLALVVYLLPVQLVVPDTLGRGAEGLVHLHLIPLLQVQELVILLVELVELDIVFYCPAEELVLYHVYVPEHTVLEVHLMQYLRVHYDYSGLLTGSFCFSGGSRCWRISRRPSRRAGCWLSGWS